MVAVAWEEASATCGHDDWRFGILACIRSRLDWFIVSLFAEFRFGDAVASIAIMS